jgi:hypothetical protein
MGKTRVTETALGTIRTHFPPVQNEDGAWPDECREDKRHSFFSKRVFDKERRLRSEFSKCWLGKVYVVRRYFLEISPSPIG